MILFDLHKQYWSDSELGFNHPNWLTQRAVDLSDFCRSLHHIHGGVAWKRLLVEAGQKMSQPNFLRLCPCKNEPEQTVIVAVVVLVVLVAIIIIAWPCTKPFPHKWVSLHWGLVQVRASGLIRCPKFTVMSHQLLSTMRHFLHRHLLLRQVVAVRPRCCIWEDAGGPPGGELQGVHRVVGTFRLWTHKTRAHVSVYPLIKVRGQVFTINFLRNPPKFSVPLASPVSQFQFKIL